MPGGATVGDAVIRGEGGVGRGVVCSKVQDAADGGKDGARAGGATAAEANDFAPDAILLGGERCR